MDNDITCYLSSRRKYRNKSEYHTIEVICCPEFNIEFEGYGKLVELMAHRLHEKNCQIDRPYAVYRGDTLVFKKVPLKRWIFKEDKRPEWLKK